MPVAEQCLTLADAANSLKCSRDNLVWMGARGDLPIYVLADDWLVDFFGINDPDTNGSGLASSPVENKTRKKSPTPFYLTGLVRLYPDTLFRYRDNPNATEWRFPAPTPEHSDDFSRYEYRLHDAADDSKRKAISLSTCSLVVMMEDVQAVATEMIQVRDKPLGTRERNVLLTIIAALSVEAKVDLKSPTKAAQIISKRIELLGGSISIRTIENHIKKIPYELKSFAGK